MGLGREQLEKGGSAEEAVKLFKEGKVDEAIKLLGEEANTSTGVMKDLASSIKIVDGGHKSMADALQAAIDANERMGEIDTRVADAAVNLQKEINSLSEAVNKSVKQFTADFKTLNKGLMTLNEQALQVAVASGEMTPDEAADIKTVLQVEKVFEDAAIDFKDKLASLDIQSKDAALIADRVDYGGANLENLMKVLDLAKEGETEDKEAIEELQEIVTQAKNTADGIRVQNKITQDVARNTRALSGVANLSKTLLSKQGPDSDISRLGQLFEKVADVKGAVKTQEGAALLERILPGSDLGRAKGREAGDLLRGRKY